MVAVSQEQAKVKLEGRRQVTQCVYCKGDIQLGKDEEESRAFLARHLATCPLAPKTGEAWEIH